MDTPLHVEVKCPHCGHTLMDASHPVDGLPSIALQAQVAGDLGHIYLSQVYGSFHKQFDGVADRAGSVAQFSCPHCLEPFPVVQCCACAAPVVALYLRIGGVVKFCSRNGCTRHWLEFEDADELFTLFEAVR